MDRRQYVMEAELDAFVGALLARLEQDPQVIGLVLAGSSAETVRRDQWSDHDFLVIVDDGVEERFRTDLAWLPHHEDLAFSFRETAHGLKALYRDGLLLEFAVFNRNEFAHDCPLNHYRVVLDRADIGVLAAASQSRSLEPRGVNRLSELRLFLSLVYVGSGRARRGERLSANTMVRQWAVLHLLTLLRDLMPITETAALDALDPWRRFEQSAPALAADVDLALAQPVDVTGRTLLQIADRELSERWDAYPRGDLQTVARLLGWDVG